MRKRFFLRLDTKNFRAVPRTVWEAVIEPTKSENYTIITAAGGNGKWQDFENKGSNENAEVPERGKIAFDQRVLNYV